MKARSSYKPGTTYCESLAIINTIMLCTSIVTLGMKVLH